MINKENLQEAITTCFEEKNPNAYTCIKLAAYCIILDRISKKDQADVMFSESGSGSEFTKAFISCDSEQALSILDEMMDTLQIVNPRIYENTIRRLRGRG